MLENINSNIKHLRELNELTQEYIASQLNISTRAYSKIETGETQLTLKRLNEISEILNVPPEVILTFDFHKSLFNQEQVKDIPYNTELEYLKKLFNELLKEKDKVIYMLEEKLSSIQPK